MLDPGCLYEKQRENGVFTALFLPLKSILQQETGLVEFLNEHLQSLLVKTEYIEAPPNAHPLLFHILLI